MKNPDPVQVIGQFHPPSLCFKDEFFMAKYFSGFLIERGYEFTADPLQAVECRPPWHEWSAHTDGVHKAKYGKFPVDAEQVHGWHRDGVALPWVSAMWSNMFPTEFILDSETVMYTPKPFDVVIVRDMECLHRTPNITLEESVHRYFVRTAVKCPTQVS